MSITPRRVVLALAALIALFAAEPAGAQDSTAKIAIAVSLNGPSSLLGQPSLYGARLAIEEANASGEGPRVELTEYDDVGDPSRGRPIAEQITASGALAVIGPASTPMALAVEPVVRRARPCCDRHECHRRRDD
jgi:branched-chain amino acid transport system substrate-binding protein